MIKKRTTIYLEDRLVKMLKFRALKTEQSVSDYISRVVYQDLIEEQQDLQDIQQIVNEPTIPFEKALKQLGIQDDVPH